MHARSPSVCSLRSTPSATVWYGTPCAVHSVSQWLIDKSICCCQHVHITECVWIMWCDLGFVTPAIIVLGGRCFLPFFYSCFEAQFYITFFLQIGVTIHYLTRTSFRTKERWRDFEILKCCSKFFDVILWNKRLSSYKSYKISKE